MGWALVDAATARGVRAGEAQRREVAKDSVILAAFVSVLAMPFAVFGPGFFREDWFFLRRARMEGDRAWAATGREARNALVYIQRCALPRATAAPLVVGPWAIVHAGVEGLSTSGDVSDALQALRDDTRRPVKFVYSARELAEQHGVDLRQAARAGSHCASR